MCPLLRYALWTVLLYNLADMSDIGNVKCCFIHIGHHANKCVCTQTYVFVRPVELQ